ncbi:MAG: Abi family protein [Bacteroidales bacterium]
MDKIFLSLDNQIKHLKDDKKIECNDCDKISLLRIGYFNLINGYKTPFTSSKDKDGNHIYAKGTTINEIIALKNFDDELRHLLLKTVTRCEEEIKTITSYLFEKSKKSTITWKSVKTFSANVDSCEIQKLISRIQFQIKERSDLEYVKFYKMNHGGILPMWIITKIIYFGTFIDLVELSKENISDDLCSIYQLKDNNGNNDVKLLIGSLHWIRIVRNACAHNERIYCLEGAGRIFDLEINKLGNRYKKNKEKKLFDLLLYLRYYMQKDDYASFISVFKDMLISLEEKVSSYAFANIRGGTGIKRIEDLDIISGDGFDNNFQLLL